ncbi:hypothetical protein HPP92_000611 [Vanilla planifolia]|uniref:Uncharacterized protein n=1 Tax=Vanilla planifolia TaxID=51239 RepID=A0A835RP64_VANPL|nr:hypothetical protein HPP92_000611 [Vanilla planifolia]
MWKTERNYYELFGITSQLLVGPSEGGEEQNRYCTDHAELFRQESYLDTYLELENQMF